ncbi:uncharacterized protein BT62DRAFT_81277 [Guyanagaster necrorhizus]|uniref:Uncharacterized protein n=1 Tax=Guyanagaster necrorhizus TaxID=856835 RepID=A0A9P7VU36_9AGAR|nr:uncharacterized protein BT62DRAFT_81277 [Guyanagaster necrorhizus MCA 3950]KAG7447418.1 hypothetical protein BT62DRAFT_81277 [Guyanagaster necrorhizus MCA 3950]
MVCGHILLSKELPTYLAHFSPNTALHIPRELHGTDDPSMMCPSRTIFQQERARTISLRRHQTRPISYLVTFARLDNTDHKSRMLRPWTSTKPSLIFSGTTRKLLVRLYMASSLMSTRSLHLVSCGLKKFQSCGIMSTRSVIASLSRHVYMYRNRKEIAIDLPPILVEHSRVVRTYSYWIRTQLSCRLASLNQRDSTGVGVGMQRLNGSRQAWMQRGRVELASSTQNRDDSFTNPCTVEVAHPPCRSYLT